jgi:SWIM zinc finger
VNSTATSPVVQSTPATLTCEHCSHTGADVGPFVSQNDGSEFVLCLDRDACMVRQGLKPPAPRPPASTRAPVRQLPSGTIQALSSDGETIYTVTLGSNPTCECKGYQYRGHCRHIASAIAALPAFYKRPLRWHPSRRYDLLNTEPVPFPGTYHRDAACDCPSCTGPEAA